MIVKMKRKVFIFGQGQQSFKLFRALLVAGGWHSEWLTSIDLNILESVTDEETELTCLVILDQPESQKFTLQESNLIVEFYKKGGSLLIASYGDQGQIGINHLVSSFGVQFNRDCLIRPNLYRHFHPKEAMIEDFVANRGLADSMKKYLTECAVHKTASEEIESLLREPTESGSADLKSLPASDRVESLKIIYPYGCSLSITNKKESAIVMTSSRWTIPSGRALCVFQAPDLVGKVSTTGRVVILGSVALMSDKFLNLENNQALVRSMMDYLQNDANFHINLSDARTTETTSNCSDMKPALDRLLDLPVSCLQECEPLPDDVSSLIDRRQFRIDGKMIPSIMRAHRDLNVELGCFGLIKPDLSNSYFDHKLDPATHEFIPTTTTQSQ